MIGWDWKRYAAERVIDELQEHVGDEDGTEPHQREYVEAFDAISDHVWGWLNAQVSPSVPPRKEQGDG
jgi:hypothetical protein